MAAKNMIQEKRAQSARSRKYYDDYQVRMRSKMLKRRTKEEMVRKEKHSLSFSCTAIFFWSSFLVLKFWIILFFDVINPLSISRFSANCSKMAWTFRKTESESLRNTRRSRGTLRPVLSGTKSSPWKTSILVTSVDGHWLHMPTCILLKMCTWCYRAMHAIYS